MIVLGRLFMHRCAWPIGSRYHMGLRYQRPCNISHYLSMWDSVLLLAINHWAGTDDKKMPESEIKISLEDNEGKNNTGHPANICITKTESETGFFYPLSFHSLQTCCILSPPSPTLFCCRASRSLNTYTNKKLQQSMPPEVVRWVLLSLPQAGSILTIVCSKKINGTLLCSKINLENRFKNPYKLSTIVACTGQRIWENIEIARCRIFGALGLDMIWSWYDTLVVISCFYGLNYSKIMYFCVLVGLLH